MGVALGGFLVRMMLVTVVVVAREGHASWVDLTALAVAILVTQLGLLVWETRYVGRQPRLPRSQASASRRARDAVDPRDRLPADQPPDRVADHLRRRRFGVNKVVLLMWLSVIVVFAFFFAAQPPAGSSCRAACRTSPSRRSTSSATASSCRRWARTACATRRSCSRCSRFIFVVQHLGDHPGRPDAGERPHRAAAVPGAARVGASTTSSASRSRASSATSRRRSFPPGVPKAAATSSSRRSSSSSIIIVRPLSLSVRLFANMLAGHLLLIELRRDHRRAVRDPVVTIVILPFSCVPADRASPASRCWWRSCRRSSSPFSPPCTSAAPCTPSTETTKETTRASLSLPKRRTPASCTRASPPSAAASSTAARPSAPASASASSSATPSRPWPASPRRPAWCAPRCSSASRSPRRSLCSASSSRSSSRAEEAPMRIRTAAGRGLDGRRRTVRPRRASRRPRRAQSTDADQLRSMPTRRPRSASKLLEEGKTIDDCQKAPSPILPATNELIWGTISFVVLLVLLWKFAWPGLKTGMDGRDRAHPRRPRRGRARQGRGRARSSTRLPGPAGRREGRVRSHHRGGAPAGRRAARDRRQRLQAELAEHARARRRPTSRRRSAGASPTCAARSRRWPSVRPRRSSQRNLDRDTQDAAHRELHQPGREPELS